MYQVKAGIPTTDLALTFHTSARVIMAKLVRERFDQSDESMPKTLVLTTFFINSISYGIQRDWIYILSLDIIIKLTGTAYVVTTSVYNCVNNLNATNHNIELCDNYAIVIVL